MTVLSIFLESSFNFLSNNLRKTTKFCNCLGEKRCQSLNCQKHSICNLLVKENIYFTDNLPIVIHFYSLGTKILSCIRVFVSLSCHILLTSDKTVTNQKNATKHHFHVEKLENYIQNVRLG